MHGSGRNDAGKMFIGGLSWDTTKDSLLSYFTQYGEVIDCIVMKNPQTGKSRGFGFVTYSDSSCVDAVLSVPGHIVDGRQVDPKACSPKGPGQQGRPGMQRGDGGGRGGGGGGRNSSGSRKIFLGGLPSNVDEEFLKEFFGKYGMVQELTIMYDPQRQRSRGFGFLTMQDDDAVEKVCAEHYINIHGKKVECKRAEPRTNKEESPAPPQQFPPMGNMPPPLELQQQQPPPQQQQPPPHGPPEGNWAPPPSELPSWNQGPPGQLQMAVTAHFPPNSAQNGAQIPGYQEAPIGVPSWPPQGQPPPQQATPSNGGGWPPGQQGAPVPSQFVGQPPTSQPYNPQPVQQPPTHNYQWAASPPTGQHPAANGQPPAPAPAQVAYGYQSPGSGTMRSPAPAGMAPKPYTDFTNATPEVPQQGFPPAPVPVPSPGQAGIPAPVVSAATPQGFSAYPSPYGAPTQVAGAAVDPYGQPVAAPSQPAPVPLPVAPSAHPAYASPVAPSPIAPPTDPTQPKPAEYAAYNPYGAYGAVSYTSEPGYTGGATSPPHLTAVPAGFPQGGATLTSSAPAPTAPSALAGYGGDATAVAAYGAAPAGTQPPYGGQGDAQSLAAYGGAPGPAPSFQRQAAGAQTFHPYRR